MKVRVLLFGPEADAARSPGVDVDVPAGSTCATLRDALASTAPALRPFLAAGRFAINHEFASPQRVIQDRDEVALIGLVSGG